MTDKRVGIITFHHPYNCGSMLQAFALQRVIERLGYEAEIIDFSNAGQKQLYSVTQPNNSVKNILKNIILFPYKDRIRKNFESFEEFKNAEFHLSPESYSRMEELTDTRYFVVVTGSDQVWNITIEDGDDAYYLPWVRNARKIAYAPSFGAKNVMKYADDPEKYKTYLSDFDALSIREENGKKWLQDLVEKDVPVLLDPTLLLDADAYEQIADQNLNLTDKYIFFYSPSYQKDIVHLVQCVSNKYHLPVIAFNTKTFYVKGMQRTGFKLPEIENPRSYLTLIKNATLIVTVMFKKSKIQMLGSYRTKPGYEDYDLWVRAIIAGLKLKNDPGILVYVRAGEDMVNRRGGIDYIKSIIGMRMNFFKLGFYTKYDLFVTISTSTLSAILPTKIRYLFYYKVLRK